MKHDIEDSGAGETKMTRKPVARVIGPAVVAASLIPLLVLSGCANHSERSFSVGSTTSTYKERHPIIIDEQEQTMDVPVASGSFDLPRASESAVEGFAYRFRRAASGSITIMMPSSSPNEAAARKVGATIADTLEKNGVPGNRIVMTTYHAAQHGSSAPVRLSYNAVKANVGRCGEWPEDLAAQNNENKNWHNFGCANQNNMAAMVANPADLLGPRGMSEIDAARRNQVIETYREGNQPLERPQDPYFEVE